MTKIATSQKQDPNGFSLVELLVVCFISLILLAASIPSVTRTLSAYRLEIASSLLSSRLLEARMTAVKHNRAAKLKIDDIHRQLEVWTSDYNGFAVRVGIVAELPRDIVFNSTSPREINFTSLGRNPDGATPIKFTLAGTSNCRTVIISAIGNITTVAGC